jgi:hypothetical protein
MKSKKIFKKINSDKLILIAISIVFIFLISSIPMSANNAHVSKNLNPATSQTFTARLTFNNLPKNMFFFAVFEHGGSTGFLGQYAGTNYAYGDKAYTYMISTNAVIQNSSTQTLCFDAISWGNTTTNNQYNNTAGSGSMNIYLFNQSEYNTVKSTFANNVGGGCTGNNNPANMGHFLSYAYQNTSKYMSIASVSGGVGLSTSSFHLNVINNTPVYYDIYITGVPSNYSIQSISGLIDTSILSNGTFFGKILQYKSGNVTFYNTTNSSITKTFYFNFANSPIKTSWSSAQYLVPLHAIYSHVIISGVFTIIAFIMSLFVFRKTNMIVFAITAFLIFFTGYSLHMAYYNEVTFVIIIFILSLLSVMSIKKVI